MFPVWRKKFEQILHKKNVSSGKKFVIILSITSLNFSTFVCLSNPYTSANKFAKDITNPLCTLSSKSNTTSFGGLLGELQNNAKNTQLIPFISLLSYFLYHLLYDPMENYATIV